MTELAVHRADLDASGHEIVSPVPDLVRVAVIGAHRQVDLSLPLDVPVALLVPEVVRLVHDAPAGGATPPPAPAADRPTDVVWVLVGAQPGGPLAPDGTLRDAGVGQDGVLYLQGRPIQAAPTLYDDVVDAAARLNQSGHAGWDPAAARGVAHLGVCLAAAAWIHLVLVDASSPRRAALLGLSAFVTVTLLVVAAIVPRSGGAPRSGAVLGWACLSVAAAGCWAALAPYGSLALAGGALALILLCGAGYRLVGAGAGGFAAAGVFFACAAVTLAAREAGLTGFAAAVCLAVGATLATLAVPRLTARWDYSRPARPDPADGQAPVGSAAARELRAGLYTGLAVGVCFAGVAALWAAPTPSWPTLGFAVVCAAALGLPRPGTRSGPEWAASGLPALALFVAAAVAGVRGDAPMSAAGASALLAGAIVLAAAGSRWRPGSDRPQRHWRTLVALCSYLAFALIVPSALWAAAAHAGWGVG